MRVDETVTYLEMKSRGQLARPRQAPAPIEMEKAGVASLDLYRSTCVRVGAPLGWSNTSWRRKRWLAHLRRADIRAWIARVDGEVAGVVELEIQPHGDVEIRVFGLVPEFVGRGFGGELLAIAARLAWDAPHPAGARTRRVWLHTSSYDHPRALRNYERGGFRVFRRESARKPDAEAV